MSFYTEQQKQEIYRKFIENGRPWFHIDKSKEPTYEERKIILEMNQRESNKAKREQELQKRTKEIRQKYTGKISDKIFDLSNY